MAELTIDTNKLRFKPTDEQLDLLRAEIERTGTGPTSFIRRAEDLPDGLTVAVINNWLNAGASARLDHFECALERWRTLPDAVGPVRKRKPARERRMTLTDAHRKKIETLIRESSMPLRSFFRERDDIPDGLTHQIVTFWVTGRTKTVLPEHYDFMIDAYRAIPKARKARKSPAPKRVKLLESEIMITREILNRLHRLQKESGIRPASLLRGRDDVPEGLTPHLIHRWLARKTDRAQKRHIDYVIEKWERIWVRGRIAANRL